jgi:hypothetical protein
MQETSTNAEQPLQCLSCWYVIGVSSAAVCPECGTPVTDASRRVYERRAALAASSRRDVRLGVVVVAGGVLTYTAIIGLVSSDITVTAIMFVATSAFAWFGWAISLAIIPWHDAAKRAKDPRPECSLVALLWSKHVLLLHTPWLLPPLLAVVLGLVGLTLRAFSKNHEMGEFVLTFLLFVIWIGASIVAVSEWTLRWNQDLDAACLSNTGVPERGGAAALLLCLLNLTAGFVGGAAMVLAVGYVLRDMGRVM